MKPPLLSPWWRQSNRVDFFFVFTSGQADNKDVVGGHFLMCWSCSACQYTFLTYDRCKQILKYVFSHCIVLISCSCLHEAVPFITFKKDSFSRFHKWFGKIFGYGKTFLGKTCDGRTNLLTNVFKGTIITQKNSKNTHILWLIRC